LPGRRSAEWIKVKARMQQEAVIGGITEQAQADTISEV
jgi:ATP-dependent DNA ligase